MIDVWISRSLLIPNCRPAPLIMHSSELDDHEELSFWNELRNFLIPRIRINYFSRLEESGELIITPHILREFKNRGLLKKVIRQNKHFIKSGRKIITFTGGPDYKPIKGEIVFSPSFYKSTKDCLQTPLWLFEFGEMPKIPKPKVPTVSFVAQAFYPGILSNFVGNLPIPLAIEDYLAGNQLFNRIMPLNATQTIARLVRQRVFRSLQNSADLELTLKIRKKGFFSHSDAEKKILKEEYVESIKHNMYNVCVRGDSNCIHQLYEFMASGRIPVFVDTNTKLPEIDGLDWEDFCIIIPFRDVQRIEDYILNFHHSHSEKQLWEKFEMARYAFEKLSPANFVGDKVLPIIHKPT